VIPWLISGRRAIQAPAIPCLDPKSRKSPSHPSCVDQTEQGWSSGGTSQQASHKPLRWKLFADSVEIMFGSPDEVGLAVAEILSTAREGRLFAAYPTA
jgi:hypothetical protein